MATIRRQSLLAYWMRQRGLTTTHLAQKIGASETHVRKVSTGTAPASRRFMAACGLALGVPVTAIWPAADSAEGGVPDAP
jgi:lambda repressor-like predicted transcriptional regulator